MTTNENWFIEHFQPTGSAIGFRITGKLDEVQSPFQKIEIYDSTDWGKLMVIDGAMMLTTKDNFFYHEMISHPVLFTHPNPKRVVIIGGGDCGTLREVLKHPGVEKAVQCDIDEQVTRMAEKYFPELCESNDDPRAELLFDDGIAYMANAAPASLDIVIVDSTDPVGPADDDHLFRVGMGEQRRVRHHLVVEEVVARGDHHRAVDEHHIAPVGRFVDLDLLEGRLHLVELARDAEADRRAGRVEVLVEPVAGRGHAEGPCGGGCGRAL